MLCSARFVEDAYESVYCPFVVEETRAGIYASKTGVVCSTSCAALKMRNPCDLCKAAYDVEGHRVAECQRMPEPREGFHLLKHEELWPTKTKKEDR